MLCGDANTCIAQFMIHILHRIYSSTTDTNIQKRRFSQTTDELNVTLRPQLDVSLPRNEPLSDGSFGQPNEAQNTDHRVIKQSNTWHAEAQQEFQQVQQPTEPFFEPCGEHRDQFYAQRARSFDGCREGPPRAAYPTAFQRHQSPVTFRASSQMPQFPPHGYQAPIRSPHASPFRHPAAIPRMGPMSPPPGPPALASPQRTQRFQSVNPDLQKCVGESKGKCVALGNPLPRKFQGNMELSKDEEVPDFSSLVNFPTNSVLRQNRVLPNGMRCCVMCGSIRRTCSRLRSRKNDGSLSPGRNVLVCGSGDDYVTIPTQNKGLCTLCDISVWVVLETGRQIKWCKGCKNFRPWAGFGDKGLATKCVRCRDRQREKYALLKNAKKNKKD